MSNDRRRTGRPAKEPTAGERVSLGLKVTAEVKQRIDAEAKASGRTQSQVAEALIERALRDEQLLPQLLDLAYGAEGAALLMLLGKFIRDTAAAAAAMSSRPSDADRWMREPFAFSQIEQGCQLALEAMRPEGSAQRPQFAGPSALADALNKHTADLGKRVMETLLRSMADSPESSGHIGLAGHIRQRVNPGTLSTVKKHVEALPRDGAIIVSSAQSRQKGKGSIQ